MTGKKEKRIVVLGVLGVDAHVVGNKIMAHALEKEGFKVVNIGTFSSQPDFIRAAIESAADAILVGSLCGHGEIGMPRLSGKLHRSRDRSNPSGHRRKPGGGQAEMGRSGRPLPPDGFQPRLSPCSLTPKSDRGFENRPGKSLEAGYSLLIVVPRSWLPQRVGHKKPATRNE